MRSDLNLWLDERPELSEVLPQRLTRIDSEGKVTFRGNDLPAEAVSLFAKVVGVVPRGFSVGARNTLPGGDKFIPLDGPNRGTLQETTGPYIQFDVDSPEEADRIASALDESSYFSLS
jgi:hypothetical protein